MKKKLVPVIATLILMGSTGMAAVATSESTMRLGERVIPTVMTQDTTANRLPAIEVKQVSQLKFPILKEGEGTKPISSPKKKEEFEKLFVYMGAQKDLEYTVEYGDISFTEAKELMNTVVQEAYDKAFATYPEYFSFTNSMNTKLQGNSRNSKLIFTLKDPKNSTEDMLSMRKQAFDKADKVIDEMISTGKIRQEMSDEQKAKVLFEWIVHNTEYDYTFGPTSSSSYGQLLKGKAVCHGYTGSFNLLAKKLGLDVSAIVGTVKEVPPGQVAEHTWSTITIDGKTSHIDTTWGDPTGQPINYKYFMADEEFMRKTHQW